MPDIKSLFPSLLHFDLVAVRATGNKKTTKKVVIETYASANGWRIPLDATFVSTVRAKDGKFDLWAVQYIRPTKEEIVRLEGEGWNAEDMRK